MAQKQLGKNSDLTTITLSLSIEYKDKLKAISIREHKPASKVLRDWIDQYEEKHGKEEF